PLHAETKTCRANNNPSPYVHSAIKHIADGGNPSDQYSDSCIKPYTDGSNYFLGTRWTGKINITASQAGAISFFTATDDGSRLWIDGNLVVDNNFFQGITERSGVATLTEGSHDVVIGYYEGGGDANLIWSWTPVGGSKQVVQNSALGGAS